ncbi:hypothetical protein [Rhizobium sp.]|jgi:HTH-type transcriptional regulator, cell division transcriptional repressor|uniref:hypothetical protein n=1 Tax=Rhizobium sp. TaxID=391 RepID=UPI000E8B7D96|nr:hypothetical protein [Rhizobium sp.]
MARFDGKDLSGSGEAAFGDGLEVLRDVAGMHASDLPGASSVCQSKLCSWKDDVCEIDEQDVSKIAKTLGVSSSWLLTGCGDGPADQSAETDMVNFLRWELERLERMHDETGAMIDALHRRIADIEQNSNF